MVVFQDADAGEHARKGARAALQMLAVTARLNQEWPEAGGPLAVHIGINSGVALVGSTRLEGMHASRWTFTANGTVANLAARLGDAAAPGTILVGPETAARLASAFVLEAHGSQTFKNLQAVNVYRLLREQ
jgi:class 3 adenylate cyclase